MIYLSWWIANAGVVPLFLLAALRSLPWAFFLFFLIILVFLVLEAIVHPYVKKLSLYSIRGINLLIFSLLVNIPTLLYPSKSFANELSSEVHMARGEQREYKIKGLSNYSVGNSEVLSVKYLAEKKTLLVKGSKVGFSDLILWAQGEKTKYQFYITSKISQLKKAEFLQGLPKDRFTIHHLGERIVIKGEVRNSSELCALQGLQQKKQIFFEGKVAEELQREIISEIYLKTYKKEFDFIKCYFAELTPFCEVKGKKGDIQKNILENKYGVQFLSEFSKQKGNFQISYKVIQVESFNESHYSLGLDTLDSKVLNALTNPVNLISENRIFFKEGDTSASLLARPEGLISLDKKHHVQMGAELPYSQVNQNNMTITSWKFAGLKVATMLKEQEGKLLINYKTEFTRPTSNQQISGTKGSGSVYIRPGVHYKIFDLGIEVEEKIKSGIPGLNQIPLLKYLFSSSHKGKSFKHIMAFMVLTPVEQS